MPIKSFNLQSAIDVSQPSAKGPNTNKIHETVSRIGFLQFFAFNTSNSS